MHGYASYAVHYNKMNYKIYIGSNNKTGKLEKAKAIKIVSSDFEGFTTSEAIGFWKGNQEKSLIVEVETANHNKLLGCIQKLIKELKQEAIGLAEVPAINFINA